MEKDQLPRLTASVQTSLDKRNRKAKPSRAGSDSRPGGPRRNRGWTGRACRKNANRDHVVALEDCSGVVGVLTRCERLRIMGVCGRQLVGSTWRERFLEFGLAWRRVPLIPPPRQESEMGQDTHLLERFAADFLRVHRGRPVPPRYRVSITTDRPTTWRRHELVLGDISLDRCLFNVGRWSPSVGIENQSVTPGCTELKLTALWDMSQLEILGRPGLDDAAFLIDGHPVVPTAMYRWPERYSFSLAKPIRRNQVFHLKCSTLEPDDLPLWMNPALFEACSFTSARTYERDFRIGGDPPGTYRNVVRPGGGTVSACQPFALSEGQHKESDERLFSRAARTMLGQKIDRRSDICRMVTGLFPSVARATCEPGSWEVVDGSGWKRRQEGQILWVACSSQDAAYIARLKAGIERYIRRHVTSGSRILVQVESRGA